MHQLTEGRSAEGCLAEVLAQGGGRREQLGWDPKPPGFSKGRQPHMYDRSASSRPNSERKRGSARRQQQRGREVTSLGCNPTLNAPQNCPDRPGNAPLSTVTVQWPHHAAGNLTAPLDDPQRSAFILEIHIAFCAAYSDAGGGHLAQRELGSAAQASSVQHPALRAHKS